MMVNGDAYLTALFTLLAVVFFAVGMRAPIRTIAIAALDGTLGYMIYILLCYYTSSNLAVFVATFVICLVAEFTARIIKAPTTIISFTAMVPLVPGVMLYDTMRQFAAGNFNYGIEAAVKTIVFAGSMSLAVSVAAVVVKIVFTKIFHSAKTPYDCAKKNKEDSVTKLVGVVENSGNKRKD